MAFIKSTNIITDVALTVPNLTGGTNGKIVRISGSNTVTDATNSDSAVLLNTLMVKMNDVYYSMGYVSGFTGLSAGSPYFLGTNGNLLSAPPTPTSTVKVVFLGYAVNTTDLIFKPGTPITG